METQLDRKEMMEEDSNTDTQDKKKEDGEVRQIGGQVDSYSDDKDIRKELTERSKSRKTGKTSLTEGNKGG